MNAAAPRSAPAALVLASVMASALACILPDRGIIIVDENVQNKHPVRFVEPIPITEESSDACLSLDEIKPQEVCQPGDPAKALPHFLDPAIDDYKFCSCDVDTQEDKRKLRVVTFYVEDRANEVGKDFEIYAALQLDIKPGETDPSKKVFYQSYLDPKIPLQSPGDSLKYEPPRRPDTGRELRELTLGNPEKGGIDLCNGIGLPLSYGFHTLRIIVTDAPWFNPTDDENDREVGVPDLANGATYDTLEFVFFCDDRSDPTKRPLCITQCQTKGLE